MQRTGVEDEMRSNMHGLCQFSVFPAHQYFHAISRKMACPGTKVPNLAGKKFTARNLLTIICFFKNQRQIYHNFVLLSADIDLWRRCCVR